MCGRYQFTLEQCEEIRQIVNDIQRRYGQNTWTPGEIAPSQRAPVLIQASGGVEPVLMRWGYRLPGSLVINARAETAMEKPTFRESVATRRCLLPSTGFFEWDQDKRKYLFRLPGEPLFYMAGLYDRRGGEECYCILTTGANESMSQIHDRMPLIIPKEYIAEWLMNPFSADRILGSVPPALSYVSAEAQFSLW